MQWGKNFNFGMFRSRKDIDVFLYYDTKLSFGSFSKIQTDFMHFESWTGVLEVQPCFEIIYNFIFRVLYLSFKFNCFCDCT